MAPHFGAAIGRLAVPASANTSRGDCSVSGLIVTVCSVSFPQTDYSPEGHFFAIHGCTA